MGMPLVLQVFCSALDEKLKGVKLSQSNHSSSQGKPKFLHHVSWLSIQWLLKWNITACHTPSLSLSISPSFSPISQLCNQDREKNKGHNTNVNIMVAPVTFLGYNAWEPWKVVSIHLVDVENLWKLWPVGDARQKNPQKTSKSPRLILDVCNEFLNAIHPITVHPTDAEILHSGKKCRTNQTTLTSLHLELCC